MTTPDTPLLSVIVPVRNRAGRRLENCLRSLRWQDLPEDEVEVIVSDFGSAPEMRAATAALAERFGARVLFTPAEEVWNRSRALNIGIRAARGRYVLCTDADMIFAPTFLRTLVEAQREAEDGALVVCRCRDLPDDVPEQVWQRSDYPALLARAPFREKLGTGACQMARREAFARLHGYDEQYVFWGMEDNDFRFRARRAGLAERWVHERTSMLHQWHPSDRGTRPVRKMLNDLRFHLTKWRRVKNRRRWGGQPA